MDGKAFRGESGEVVRGFLSPATFLTALPVGAAALLLGIAASFVQRRFDIPLALAVPAYLALVGPLTGLFAMASRAGAHHAGFFEALAGHGGRGAASFTLRYGLLQAAWSVPLVLVAQQAAPWLGRSFLQGLGAQATLATWTLVALATAALVAPALTLLVATRCDDVGEAFSAAAWRWVLRERRADLVPFLASALGGMTLFLLAALPPLALLLPLAADLAPELGAGLIFALPMLPAATTPILLGRLAGAFAAAEPATSPAQRSPDEPVPGRGPRTFDVPVPQASRTVAALAGIPRAAHLPSRMDCPTNVQPAREGGISGVPLGVAIARAHQLADTDMGSAIAELESLRSQHPRNPAVVAELARVLRKGGRQDEAIQAAATAIRLALTGGAGPIAHDVFRAFAQDAAALNLEPATYEQLARILSARREFDGAAWCYRAAAALGGDPKPLQKGMLGVAESALQGGHVEQAVAVYEAFVKTWPESQLARFAKDSADEARRKLHAMAGHRG